MDLAEIDRDFTDLAEHIRARLAELDIALSPWQRQLIDQWIELLDHGDIYVTDPRAVARRRISRMHIAYSRKRGHHR